MGESECYCGSELRGYSGVLTRGSLGVQGGSRHSVLRWVGRPASCFKARLRLEQVDKKRAGEWAFHKAAGLERRGLKQKPSLGAGANPVPLLGGEELGRLLHWLWLGCRWEEPACGKGGGNPGGMVVGK